MIETPSLCMKDRVAAHDWSRTPLGPMTAWPTSLATAVGICLNSRFPMFVWWGGELVNIYNDAYAPVLGARHPRALGAPAATVWREIWDVVGPQAEAVMKRGESTWNERVLLVMERSGFTEETWFTWSYSPISDDTGAIGGVFCACTEETSRVLAERQRVAAEETLRSEEARSRTILESITDGYFALDRDWKFTYVNPQAERILELAPGEVIGRSIWDVYPGLPGTEFERAYRRTADEQVAASFTSYYPDHKRWYEAHTYPVGDGITVYFRDVTDRKRAEEALREGATRLELVLASAQVGDWDLDLVTNTSRRSLRHDQCFGYSTPLAHWGRETLLAHVHPEDRASVAATFDAGIATGETWQIDCRVLWPDGTSHWIALHGSRYRTPEEGAPRMLGIVFDITERKRVEHEMARLAHDRESLLDAERAARVEADRASNMKDEFLATLSHELRTPLHAILGWSQLMREARDSTDMQKGLAVIERNARAQSQIIDDLLDMSRIISGKIQLDIQRVDLASVVAAAVETARPMADARKVQLVAAIEPLDHVVVHGDPSRYHQILWNLLTNAVKFTPGGGEIRVTLVRHGTQLELSVRDSGQGIAPEFLPFVFDRFRQADPTITRRHGGLGLGLSIVKQLVELHGGSVAVASPGRGEGATFTVTLPLDETQPAIGSYERSRAAQRPLTSTPPLSRIELEGVRVLVVDDEPDARSLVTRLLEDCHARVTSADSAGEAMRLISAGTYDVLVSDIGMPGEDGYALIRRVRALGKGHGGDLPAIALTAYARTEDRVKAISSGFQMHVAKPVEALELLTMVAGAAGRIAAS